MRRRRRGIGLGFPLKEAFRAPGLHAWRRPGRSNAPVAKGRPVYVAEPLVALLAGVFVRTYVSTYGGRSNTRLLAVVSSCASKVKTNKCLEIV